MLGRGGGGVGLRGLIGFQMVRVQGSRFSCLGWEFRVWGLWRVERMGVERMQTGMKIIELAGKGMWSSALEAFAGRELQGSGFSGSVQDLRGVGSGSTCGRVFDRYW